ncbi:MAG: strawberry notch-like NTP hydrolase domain-containing protein, partial [Bacillota bacterium]
MLDTLLETKTATDQVFGGTQAEGAYTPKDASDRMELMLNQHLAEFPQHYDPTASAEKARGLIADLSALVEQLPTQTRRTPETDKYQQSSTPPHYAYALAWAANIGRADVVLEPSAGVGGLAVFALNAGATAVYVNELSPRRAALLRKLPFTGIFTENAEQIDNILPESIKPTVVLMNPPFSAAPNRMAKAGRMVSAVHVEQALRRLVPGGRLVAILGESMAMDRAPEWWQRIGSHYAVRANVAVPGREYRKYGTAYGTQLIVIDKVQAASKPLTDAVASVVDLIDVLASIRQRLTDRPLHIRPHVVPPATHVVASPRKAQNVSLTDAIFEPYRPQRLHIPGSQPHPTDLVQSAAMSSVLPPEPTYVPAIPQSLIDCGLLSDAQVEAVVYAGQAHQQFLEDGSRKGFFIGDGTGVGKGRDLCGIILDDFNRHPGPRKAIWITKGPKLFNDAKRDWTDLGGDGSLLFNLVKVKPQEAIPHTSGILFTTYATLKSGRLSTDKSRVQRIVNWVGPDFDGVICFDESHACKNATTLKEERGRSEASDTALAASDLQKSLPKAKVVYASATGATEVENLAYVDRLGLWGRGTAFADKLDFIAKIKSGGVAAMELVARDAKQLGLYLARNLSFEGVQYERLEHTLSADQRDIYDKLVEGWQVVLNNFKAALELIAGYYTKSGHLKVDGKVKAAALSAFWSTHQRFFNQALISMQMPSVIGDIEQQLAAGNACVLQLVNTNEA